MKIESVISSSVIEAIKALYGQDVEPKMVQIQKTKQEFAGGRMWSIITNSVREMGWRNGLPGAGAGG